jgi:hypothetical protein
LSPLRDKAMFKSIANSKLFFVALGITVALVGVRASANPTDREDSVERSAARIADSLEKIQRDGIKVEMSQKWGEEFKVKVAK